MNTLSIIYITYDVSLNFSSLSYLNQITTQARNIEVVVVYRHGNPCHNFDFKWIRQHSGMTSAAFNLGLFASKSDFCILYCDDDYISPKFIAYFNQMHLQDDVIICGYENEFGIQRIPCLKILNGRIDWRYVSFTSMAVRRNVLVNIGGMSCDYVVANDVELITNIFSATSKILLLNDCFNKRMTGGQSDTHLLQGLQEAAMIYELSMFHKYIFISYNYVKRSVSYIFRRCMRVIP